MLLQLKENLKESAYYLPANSDLFFDNAMENNFSSGERQVNALHNLRTLKGVQYLLLDEWDANLDNNNKQLLSTLLDKLSLSYCILEVRHHQ